MGDELKPCRACGSPCEVGVFTGPTIDGEARLWMCVQHKYRGGNCPDDNAYLTEDAWNTRHPHHERTDR